MIDLSVKFDEDPEKKLEGLQQNIKNKIMKRAIRAAIKPVVQAVKLKAPRTTGLLAKSIGSKVDSYPKSLRFITIGLAGARSKFKVGDRQPSKYGNLVEFGSKKGQKKKTPFLKPALDSTQGQGQQIILRIVAEGVNQELNK